MMQLFPDAQTFTVATYTLSSLGLPSTFGGPINTAGPILPAPTGISQTAAGTTTATLTFNGPSGATWYLVVDLVSGAIYGQGASSPISLTGLPSDAQTDIVVIPYAGRTEGDSSASYPVSTGTSAPTNLGPAPAPLPTTTLQWSPSVPGWTETTSGPIGALPAGSYSQVPLVTIADTVGDAIGGAGDPFATASWYAMIAGIYGSPTPAQAAAGLTAGPVYTGCSDYFFAAVNTATNLMNDAAMLGYTSGYATIDACGNLVAASPSILAALNQPWSTLVQGTLGQAGINSPSGVPVPTVTA